MSKMEILTEKNKFSYYLVKSFDNILVNKVRPVHLTASIGQTHHSIRHTVAIIQGFVAEYFQISKWIVYPSSEIFE